MQRWTGLREAAIHPVHPEIIKRLEHDLRDVKMDRIKEKAAIHTVHPEII